MIDVVVTTSGITDRGSVREQNQDQFFVADLSRCMQVKQNSVDFEIDSRLFGPSLGHLFVVADGMGGHRGGKEASNIAIQHFVAAILNSLRWGFRVESSGDLGFTEDLKRILTNAHKELKAFSATDKELAGMGTTLTMAYVAWPRLFMVHAGDTRCYIMRNDELRLVTRDHTVANHMMRTGKLDPSTPERSPWANVLVNALGAGASDVFADIYKVELQHGDRLLMCSDGLNKHVEDREILKVLQEIEDPNLATAKLLKMAIEGGGSDNITIIVSQFQAPESEPKLQIVGSAKSDEKVLRDIVLPSDQYETSIDEGTKTLARGDDLATMDYNPLQG